MTAEAVENAYSATFCLPYLLTQSNGDEAATIALLNDLRQQALDGGDFFALAKQHSEDLGLP